MAEELGKLPLVSVIIPTYNEEKFIGRCLYSLYNQDYPKNRMEIIVVDNGSEDKTLEIVKEFSKKKHKVLILSNTIKNSDVSKFIGLQKAKGDLIYFGDADVILEEKNWLNNMVLPFLSNKNIFASECEWGYLKDFSTIARYCALLQIADPLARMITNKNPKIIEQNKKYSIHKYENKNPILYCVLWKKKDLEKIKWNGNFTEGNAPLRLINNGINEVAFVKNVRAYHYYVSNLSDFIKKRKKIARKYLERKQKEETWVEKNGNLRLYLSAIYCFSIILPFFEGVKNAIRDREAAWLLHPVACFLTARIYAENLIKNKLGGKSK